MGEDAQSAAATKRCPHCAEEIQAAATRCRYCQADFAAVAAKRAVSKALAGFGALCLVGIAALAFIAWQAWQKTSAEGDARRERALDKYRAAVAAIDYRKPTVLGDVTRMVGDNPMLCRDAADGVMCQWVFEGAGTINVYADSKQNGAAVRRVETR